MKVEQIYTGCLAEAAYYIESNGEAVIIDPLRETDPYIERAEADGARIKYVLETHFHADFVSGHLDLANKTGATIVFGPTAKPNFEAHIATDGEELKVGNVTIKVLHTPGHTMESSTFLLFDENGKEHAIFTGDTLFLGDVGRPDLAVKTDLSREDLAGHLFDSLRNKIMPLSDEVIVYPGHGAGSACGKKMSSETWGYLGDQKKTNYALQPMTREEFVKEVTDGLVAPPQYFPKNAVMNKMGYDSIDDILAKGLNPLSVRAFKAAWAEEEALVIDTRHQDDFANGFIPGSIFIGIDDNFAMWVGALITDLQIPILIVADEGRQKEVVTRLARVGYDNPIGYLEGGFEAWAEAGEEVDTVEEVTATDLADRFEQEGMNVLDVRKASEYNAQHVIGAQNFPLDFINSNMSEVSRDKRYFLHCAGGYRSMITASILKSRGYNDVVNIKGGYKALVETNLPMTEFEEQITEL
ncbi:MBL fold metallo-hydrolase [Phaeodactylibacter sp.]|jgi:glyoxylase-like metal-dependent hydrolase (beta-lactamase superfamily II)/rhodanese-related sulfurtransferase|uniref:MBL fold metallo-hydrolase n=1 Tax=Phaeodactylibacter sp. TaxID=1940289 RepID=UPI0025DC5366|nr:MBL fold metallo-hydrolase [Phaeodactylibacter sp.]MCI4651017.1 MBL fold metallo-hydrolase [Phaeodactylibacter sp.]MCI5089370.1 MBL fold metallo-hydrolase [Phaeodactylibacter sp.]